MNHKIPVVSLGTKNGNELYSKALLEHAIDGIRVQHVAISNRKIIEETIDSEHKAIYLFVKGIHYTV